MSLPAFQIIIQRLDITTWSGKAHFFCNAVLLAVLQPPYAQRSHFDDSMKYTIWNIYKSVQVWSSFQFLPAKPRGGTRINNVFEWNFPFPDECFRWQGKMEDVNHKQNKLKGPTKVASIIHEGLTNSTETSGITFNKYLISRYLAEYIIIIII